MILVVSCLVLGIVIGISGAVPDKAQSLLSRLSFACLLVMLTALGAKLGAAEGILERLGLMGTRALLLALFAILGSVALVYPLQHYWHRRVCASRSPQAQGSVPPSTSSPVSTVNTGDK